MPLSYRLNLRVEPLRVRAAPDARVTERELGEENHRARLAEQMLGPLEKPRPFDDVAARDLHIREPRRGERVARRDLMRGAQARDRGLAIAYHAVHDAEPAMRFADLRVQGQAILGNAHGALAASDERVQPTARADRMQVARPC